MCLAAAPAQTLESEEESGSASALTSRRSSKQNDASEVQSSDKALSNQLHNISEEQMLDTAEQILTQLAQTLIRENWTVFDVFAQPPEILRLIPEYDGETNIRVLEPHVFLGRIYQAGLKSLTPLQISCLMRVLSKPEVDDVVRYDELELLLENFGVHRDEGGKGAQDYYEDDFNDTNMSGADLNIVEDESPSDNLERVVNSQVISDRNMATSGGDVLFIDDTSRPNFEFRKKDAPVPENSQESLARDQTQPLMDPETNKLPYKELSSGTEMSL